MSKPTAKQLAPNVPAIVRDYCAALVQEAITAQNLQATQRLNSVANRLQEIEMDLGNIQAMVASLDDKFNADTRIQLTRAKVALVWEELTRQDTE